MGQSGSPSPSDGESRRFESYHLDFVTPSLSLADQSVRLIIEGSWVRIPQRGLLPPKEIIMTNIEDQLIDEANRLKIPHDAGEWLDQWNYGEIVYVPVVGGIGVGYETAIYTATAAILQRMLDNEHMVFPIPTEDSDEETRNAWKNNVKRLRDEAIEADDLSKTWQFSGAQVGAATSVAIHFLRSGPHESCVRCTMTRGKSSLDVISLQKMTVQEALSNIDVEARGEEYIQV